MAQEELARITASGARRVIGVGSMMGLGALIVYVALTTADMAVVWKAVLLVTGIAGLVLAQLMWQSTGHALVLTQDGLSDSDGTVVARLDQIAKVDRGMFAMKPSNGFLVILKDPAPWAWRPGLWWRLGRRVAVGGVTAASQTRPVADIMTHLLTEREG